MYIYVYVHSDGNTIHNFHESLQNSYEVGANNIHSLWMESDIKYLT